MKKARKAEQYAQARALGETPRPSDATPGEVEAWDCERALATYKDPLAPVLDALETGLEMLRAYLPGTTNPELLGIGAAIEKRLYERDLQREHLVRGIAYVRRGHRSDRAFGWPSQGYPGINAAFMLDMLAAAEPDHDQACHYRRQADAIRAEIVRNAEAICRRARGSYFALVTLGEAALGLGLYDQARTMLAFARAAPSEDWEKETTGRQLAALLRLRSVEAPEAGHALKALFPTSQAEALRESVMRGKVGLALSGGGFRASFYHLGLLRRLAEIDLLRHVEVLSCVSGGSIVGMAYYLALKQLYDDKRDEDLVCGDYVKLVDDVTDRFARAVEQNIRLRVLFDVADNFAMLRGERSRTQRAGELFQELIYGEKPRLMRELCIQPKGFDAFRPEHDNGRRLNKVPVLVINATSLNTGHPWQFTATEMGEPPPARAASDVDVNDRFVRAKYDAFPARHQEITIGQAVGASAGVPGIFEPLVLEGAYGEHTALRLVDGGVYDNQGAAALLERDCTALVVSDASGQMSLSSSSGQGSASVLARADTVLQSRVRQTLFDNLKSRERGRLLRSLVFVHLKSGFRAVTRRPDVTPEADDARLPYGISREIQEKLADIRTDLDAFNVLERTLLMASGYRMAEHYVKPPAQGSVSASSHSRPGWLEDADALLASSAKTERVLELLTIGGNVFGKAWLVEPRARAVRCFVAVAALVIAAIAIGYFWSAPATTITVGALATTLVPMIVTRLLPWTEPWFDLLRGPRKWVRPLWMALGLALVARFSVCVGDPIYLEAGRRAMPERKP